ncbi:MAG: hypothetical protein ABIH42_02165 [Planctomycetota bacterium]
MKQYAGRDLEEYRDIQKKYQENRLVSGLLLRLGFTGTKIILNERPDALVDFSDANAASTRLGCEICSLQGDCGARGSKLREFHSRWIKIMERVVTALSSHNTIVPYCTVFFRNSSYSCLSDIRDCKLVSEFVIAGQHLCETPKLTFPNNDMPNLSLILSEIRVVESDGNGLLWWPAHLKSGENPILDDAIVEAVKAKSKIAVSFDWKNAAEKLLLLIAEGRGLTDVIGEARKVNLPSYLKIPFTWILVWDRFSEDIWSLFPRYAEICDGEKKVRRSQFIPLKLRKFSTRGELYPTKPKTH